MVILLWAGGLALVALNTLVLAALIIVRPGGEGELAARWWYNSRRRRRESPAVFNFWDELTRDQQHALVSVATRRTYPRGTTIFREGQPADHVVIIRSGWAKICVRENGRKRLVAERGPGELLGERAALQEGNVRSATVVALDTVEALILRTPAFANFISRYPRVLAIVEGQVYNRLTQALGQRVHSGRPAISETSSGTDSPDERLPRLNGHSCTIVMTDIAAYNATYRTADDRELIRQRFRTITPDAFVHAGIPWNECPCRDRGDGLLIVVPPAIPPATVMGALTWMAAELKSHNRRSTRPVQIQLRVAVHVGPVTTDGFGLAGETLILASRLLEARALKRSMTETGAPLGVIASRHMYDTVIKDLNMEGFRQVRGKVKESSFVAWMQLADPALPPA